MQPEPFRVSPMKHDNVSFTSFVKCGVCFDLFMFGRGLQKSSLCYHTRGCEVRFLCMFGGACDFRHLFERTKDVMVTNNKFAPHFAAPPRGVFPWPYVSHNGTAGQPTENNNNNQQTHLQMLGEQTSHMAMTSIAHQRVPKSNSYPIYV